MTAVRWHLSFIESRAISATAVSNTGRPPVTAVSSCMWLIAIVLPDSDNISRAVMMNFCYGLWMTFVKLSSRKLFRKIREAFSVSVFYVAKINEVRKLDCF